VTVCGPGLVSNSRSCVRDLQPEAQRLGLRGKTGTVDCSKSIISLDFFEYFLALFVYILKGIAECKHLCQDNCAAINEAKKQ
jgi:hypothetical protein